MLELLTWLYARRDEDMTAMIWAKQIILCKKTYAQVPRLLKEKVKKILTDNGYGKLAAE